MNCPSPAGLQNNRRAEIRDSGPGPHSRWGATISRDSEGVRSQVPGLASLPFLRAFPSSRTQWWTAKIADNKARDARVEAELRSLGWHVVTIWACAVKNKAASDWLEDQLPALLGPQGRKKSKRMTYDEATISPVPMVTEE